MIKNKNKPLGLAQGAVELRRYDRRWPGLFARESARLRRELRSGIVAIEHIGSTAIPGMPAKPLLDMMAAVSGLADLAGLERTLRRLGYQPLGPMGVPGRLLYTRGPRSGRTHHLSFTALDGLYWRDQLLFRDFLRAHPHTACQYKALKRDLHWRHKHARHLYTAGKTAFVAQVIRLAERERATGSRPARP
ncbi:MAG: GrpB family protein [Kiloniellales bacterium]|nr:GrpB family protein [Kiloniellales bacterium]